VFTENSRIYRIITGLSWWRNYLDAWTDVTFNKYISARICEDE